MGGIDTSIYSNLQTNPGPSLLDSAQKGMALSTMGMQNVQMARDMSNQLAMRDAYSKNVDAKGNLNQQGFLSDIGKVNPAAAMQYSKQFTDMGKSAAEAQIAQNKAMQENASVVARQFQYLDGMSESDRAKAYPSVVKQLVDSGVAKPGQLMEQYDPTAYRGYSVGATKFLGQNSDMFLGQEKTKAETAEKYSQIGEVGDKRVQALKEDLDPSKARPGTPFAQNQSRLQAAQRLQGLLQQTGGNPDRRQMEELAIGMQNMLSSGNASVEQVKELVPKSVWGDANKLYEWYSGNPQGTDQQNFVKRMGETIQREKDISGDQLKQTQLSRLSAHGLLLRTNPNAAHDVLSGYGITPEDIAAARSGKNVGGSGAGMAEGSQSSLKTKLYGTSKPDQSGGLVSSANAGEAGSPKAPPASGLMIRMKGPDGKIRNIPASMKGEAIAAGGEVVK